MSKTEMTVEIWKDLGALYKSTLNRLLAGYDRERRRGKIAKERTYQRCYPIRTRAKNNWLVFLEKAPATPHYKTENDVVYCAVVFYSGPRGYSVFKPLLGQGSIIVYKGHLFTRYNERLQLALNYPLDIVKRFFAHSGYSDHKLIEKKDRLFSMGVTAEGILLGDYWEEHRWLINRTFVNRDLYSAYQDETEKELITEMEEEIATAVAEENHVSTITYKADTLQAIKGNRKGL